MVSLLAACLIGTFPAATVNAAYADYYAQRSLGYECRYLLASEQQAPVAKFVAVLASREPLLDHTVPAAVQPGLLRLNLTALHWSAADWSKVCGAPANPYTVNADQLIVPAGFFIDRVTDQTRSDAYFRLLFGGDKQPKTLTEFLSVAGGIDRSKQRGLEQLHVEASSGVNVAKNGARLVELIDGTHSNGFVTYDVKQVAPGADPLEQLDRNFKFDGAECYVLMPKVSTRGIRGVFPVTCLANGKEQIVFEAPTDLVKDHQETGGFASIRNPLSCTGCHAASQPLTINALRDRLSKGVELLSYSEQRKVEIELKHLANMSSALESWNTGYAEALSVVNGLSPAENSRAFAAVVFEYRKDVTLEAAAAELHCDSNTLRLAIAYGSAQSILLDNRVAGLPHGIAIPRSSFEAAFTKIDALIAIWRKATQ